MSKVTVGFSKARNDLAIGSTIISAAEKRDYSHAYVRFELDGIDVVAQASHGLIHLIAFTRFDLSNDTVKNYDFELSHLDFLIFKTKVMYSLGTPYATWQLMIIAAMKILNVKKLPKWLYNKLSDGGKRMICSEFDVKILPYIDKTIKIDDIQADFFTPSDLDKLLEKHNG